jgi:hypothetical protein
MPMPKESVTLSLALIILHNIISVTKVLQAIVINPIILPELFVRSSKQAAIPIIIKHNKTNMPIPCKPFTFLLEPKTETRTHGKNIEIMPTIAEIKTSFLCLLIS